MNSYWKNKNQQFSYQRVDNAKYQQLLANCFNVIKFDQRLAETFKATHETIVDFFQFFDSLTRD